MVVGPMILEKKRVAALDNMKPEGWKFQNIQLRRSTYFSESVFRTRVD